MKFLPPRRDKNLDMKLDSETKASFSTPSCSCSGRKKLTSRKTKAVLIAEILVSCSPVVKEELSALRKKRALRKARGPRSPGYKVLLHPAKIPSFASVMKNVEENLPCLTKHELLLAQHGLGIAHS